jgi:hypothetical protein
MFYPEKVAISALYRIVFNCFSILYNLSAVVISITPTMLSQDLHFITATIKLRFVTEMFSAANDEPSHLGHFGIKGIFVVRGRVMAFIRFNDNVNYKNYFLRPCKIRFYKA